eukprot:1009200-Amphidinium_carterae.1
MALIGAQAKWPESVLDKWVLEWQASFPHCEVSGRCISLFCAALRPRQPLSNCFLCLLWTTATWEQARTIFLQPPCFPSRGALFKTDSRGSNRNAWGQHRIGDESACCRVVLLTQ